MEFGNTFQSQTTTDLKWIGAGLVALCFLLFVNTNTYIPSTIPDLGSHGVEESMRLLEAAGFDTDTLGYKVIPLFDEKIGADLVSKYGIIEARELSNARFSPQYSVQIDIAPTLSQNLNFSGNSSLPRTYGHSERPISGGIAARFIFSPTGDLIGGFVQQHDSLHVVRDIQQALSEYLPNSFQSLSYTESSDSNVHMFVAELTADQLFSQSAILMANMHANDGSLWVGFDTKTVVAGNIDAPALDVVPSIVGQIALFMFIAGLIVYVIVFVIRLRQGAVSTTLLTTVTALSTVYFILSIFSLISFSWILFAVVSITYVIISMFFAAAPSAAAVSLAIENMPDKFYTFLMPLKQRMESYYHGRSLIVGLSISLLSLCLTQFLYVIADALGISQAFGSSAFASSAGFFLAFSSLGMLFSTTVSNSFLTAMAIILPLGVAFKFFGRENKLGQVVAFILSCVSFSLTSMMLGGSLPFVIVHGIVLATLIYLALKQYDILAIAVAGGFYGLFIMVPMLFQSAVGVVLFAGATLAVLVPGIIGYRKQPEDVVPDDYKPSFLREIDEKKRIEQELTAAKTVQQRLLPTVLPSTELLQCAAVCIPANEVGGDYYDVFSLPNGEVGVLVGDVSGKGLSAAFYITLAKGVIASQVQGNSDPAAVLHKVNELLYGMMERGKFISMVYGVINPHEKTFTFANAGHPPSALYSGSERTVKFLPMKGMAIGLDRGARFKQAVHSHCVKLQSEDMVVLYTDGVTEAMAGNQRSFDDRGLIRSLKKAGAQPAKVVDTVLEDIDNFRGSTAQHDDITLFAFKLM